MSFKTELCVKVIGKQAFEVTAPLVYENDYVIIQVNPKFDFDGASIPRALWSIVGSPMTDGYQRAGCLHDALYASEYFDRKMCDELFLEAMISDGVSEAKAKMMYYAVRSFGWLVWRDHKKEEVDEYKKFVSFIDCSCA